MDNWECHEHDTVAKILHGKHISDSKFIWEVLSRLYPVVKVLPRQQFLIRLHDFHNCKGQHTAAEEHHLEVYPKVYEKDCIPISMSFQISIWIQLSSLR